MSTTRPFAYNTGTTIGGTSQVGDIAVGTTNQAYSTNIGGIPWWMGPDEDTGYVITVPVSGNTQPTPLFSGAPSGQMSCSTIYKGVDINLSNNNQTASQQFGYQMSVLTNTFTDNNDKVMFSVLSTSLEPLTLPQSRFIGVGKTTMNYQGNPYGGYPGNDTQSIGFNAIGEYYYNGSVVQSGLPTWTSGDIIDIAISHGQYWWIRVNGGNWNNNPAANPATLNGGLTMNGLTNYYPALCPGYEGTMTIQNTVTYGTPIGYTLLGTNINASLKFYRTKTLTDNDFIGLSNYVASKNNTPQNFSSATDASIWLTNNGFWNSYITPVLYLDAGNVASYPGTGTVWTDLVGGKQFNLINGPTYDSGNGGKIQFQSSISQYAECNTSLTSLPEFTTSVWHYWDGVNSGGLPCILTEIYVGGSLNYILGAPQGSVAQSGYFNGNFQVSPQFTLTANNWYQIVTTCDASQNISVYVNNTLISTTPTTGSQPSSSNAGIRLMSRWDGLECWGGYLSTVAIYDKALDSTQISSIWNTTKSRYGL